MLCRILGQNQGPSGNGERRRRKDPSGDLRWDLARIEKFT